MSHRVFRSSRKYLLSFLSTACVILASYGAGAAPVEGCDDKVWQALQAKAQAKVAYDVATTEQFIDKPDSVLAMTCFNQAAGVSAEKGGDIFSKDFTDDLKGIIEPALSDHYKNFKNAAGYDTGKVDYAATTLDSKFDCKGMGQLWELTKTEGVQSDVPNATIDDLVNGTKPANGGDDFNDSWDASAAAGKFTELKDATDALPKPEVPDFSSCKNSADVLALAQSGTACP